MIPVDGKEGPADVCVIESGGTIGDIESMPLIEAFCQFSYRVGPGNFCLVHVSLIPVLNVVGKQKTKPTQHSVRGLRGLGLTLNILACRSTTALDDNVKRKLSQFYHVSSGLALLHASVGCRKKLVVDWVEASHLEDITAKEDLDIYRVAWNCLKGADGILVPGGFGDRGVQGKILAAKNARESKVPFLGICLGIQIVVIEYARSILGLHDENNTEFDPKTSNPCVIFMLEGLKTHIGGTMRLGSRRTYFKVPDCKSAKLYGDATFVDERYWHKYEVNPDMISELEAAGLSFIGRDESGRRMEILELPSHPYFIGVQFHPEFKSRPGKPSAFFSGLIAASCGQLDSLLNKCGHVHKAMENGISNGKASFKARQNGNYLKSSMQW
ncbi:hypothetical protein REPUB_Repub19eG0137100 [Reevesia pubescens]